MDVKEKVCIITGSAQGLGKEYARVLLENGARVCLSDLEEVTKLESETSALKEFRETFGKEKVCYFKCDVTKEEDLVSLYDNCESYFKGKVSIFCNNAGVNYTAGWKKCMEVDIVSLYFLV